MTKFEDNGSESENEQLKNNKPNSMNSQNLDTVRVEVHKYICQNL